MNKVRPHDLRRLREVSGLTAAECVTTTVQLYTTGELGFYGIEELARDLEWSGPRPGGLTLRLRGSWGTEVRGWSYLALGGVG
jgi:hypothetical protein